MDAVRKVPFEPWPPQQRLYDPDRAERSSTRPAIFLSASVPYPKEFPPHLQFRQERNRIDVASAQPRRIFSAVSYLARFAFQRGYDLIFGAHPAISPMVLDLARRMLTDPQKRVTCFQSKYFPVDKIPVPTWDLERLGYGEILWTEAKPPDESDRANPDSAKDRSLTWMRQLMVSHPALVAAVFVGGMDGLDEEAALFQKEWGDRSIRYAIPTTGGAAQRLFNDDPEGFSGRPNSGLRATLEKELSYPLLMERIFDDLAGRA